VNYSGAPLDFPEGDEFDLESSGAHQTLSGAPDQGAFRVAFCSLV
jgi:hypothetical protein